MIAQKFIGGPIAILIICFFASWTRVLAVESNQPTGDPTTCAILADAQVKQTPVANLLQAALAREPGVRLVERESLAEIVRELQLSQVMGPDKGPDRVKLGRLIKADLLIFLSTPPNHPKAIELVVCETRSGLRLCVQEIEPQPDNPDRIDPTVAMALLQPLVAQAVAKSHQKVEQIVAVPPFVSDDLGFEFAYLKRAYAKLIEQSLLNQPGWVVVEIEEAQAIAREAAIAGRNKIDRTLPLYFLGSYRNDGVGERRRVKLSLSLNQGNQPIHKAEGVVLAPDAVGPYLLQTSTQWLPPVNGAVAKLPPPAPPATRPAETAGSLEARQLAERAMRFQRVGEWDDSLPLMEASLLLDPAQPLLRREAVRAAMKLSATLLYPIPRTVPRLERGIAVHDRGLEHLRIALQAAFPLNLEVAARGFIGDLESEGLVDGDAWRFKRDDADVKALIAAAAKRERTTIWDLVQQRQIRIVPGTLAAQLPVLMDRRIARSKIIEDNAALFHWATYQLDAPEQLRLLSAIAEHFVQPGDNHATFGLYRAQLGLDARRISDALRTPQGLELLQQWKQSGNLVLTQCALQLGSELRPTTRPLVTAKVPAGPAATQPSEPAPDLTFRKVNLAFDIRRAPANPDDLSYRLLGSVPIRDGGDVFWTTDGLYLLARDSQRLTTLWHSPGPRAHFVEPVFDGKYVWAVCRWADTDWAVVVVDPESGTTWEFGRDDGLPPLELRQGSWAKSYVPILLKPAGPGKACVVASTGRAWIVVLSVNPAQPGAKAVHVVLEARDAVDSADRSIWKDANAVFSPRYLVGLSSTSSDAPATAPSPAKAPSANNAVDLLVVGRWEDNHDLTMHPLLVDPVAMTVRVSPQVIFRDPVYASGPSLYCVEGEPGVRDQKEYLIGFHFPDGAVTNLTPGQPFEWLSQAQIIPYRGRFLLVGMHIEQQPSANRVVVKSANTLGGPYRTLSFDYPKHRNVQATHRFCLSNHFGLMEFCDDLFTFDPLAVELTTK